MRNLIRSWFKNWLDLKDYTLIGDHFRFLEGVKIGKNVYIDCSDGELIVGKNTNFLPNSMVFTHGGVIEIGENCTLNPFSILYGHGGLKIGNAVRIAAHCTIIPANHIFADPHKQIREQGLSKIGIVIEDDVWIGTGCRILDGVTIGKGSVIAAGAVVTKSVDPYTVVGGIPAKKISSR